MIRRTVTDVFRLYRGSWWRLAVLELLLGLLLAALTYGLLLLSQLAVAQLRSVLTTGGRLNTGAVTVFGLVVVVVFLLICLPLFLGGIAAIIRVTDDQLAGKRPSTFQSLASGLRDGLRMVAGSAVAVLILLALFVLTPVITAVSLLGLVLTPLVRLVRRRWPGFAGRMPSVRLLLRTLIPFGLAARWLAQALLFLPEAALKPAGPITSLRRTAPIADGRRRFIVLSFFAAVIVTTALDAGLSYLGTLLGGDFGTVAEVVAQLLFVSLPIVVLVVVYRLGEVTGGGSALPPSPTAPYGVGRPPRRTRRKEPGVVSPAWTRRIAIIMPAVLILTGLATPLAANATEAPSLTMTVNSAADDTDPGTLATEQQNCQSVSGTCTLRAALAQAAVMSSAASAITIDFSGDFTIPVTAASPLTFNDAAGGGDEGGAEGGDGASSAGTLTIDGLGHAVTIDGQNASQDMSLFSHSRDFIVKGLEFKNGNAPAGASMGGGLYVGDGRTLLVDSVTFDHNAAMAGGGLYANGTVTVQNSTFSANSLATPDGNSLIGGADLFNAGQVTAVNDTFAGSSGGSIYNLYGSTLSLNNSLMAIDASAAHGGFDCGGTGFTGTNNVVGYGDATCPGLVPVAGTYLGTLTRVSPGAPPVHNLLPSFSAARGVGGSGAGAVPCPSVDERGLARPSTGCDVGAYQFDQSSTTTVTSSANPANYGDGFGLTATARPTTEPVTVTSGTIQFFIDDVATGSPITVQPDGTAGFYDNSLDVGSYRVTASYTPVAGGPFTASSTASELTEVVQSAGTPVWLSSDAPTAAVGDPVTFTITAGPSTHPITGTVTLTDITDGLPGTVVGSVPLGTDATAQITTSTLPVGPRTLTASYAGDANNAAGLSRNFAEDIQTQSTVVLAPDQTPAVYGAPITFTATVAASAGSVPTGSMLFSYGPGNIHSQSVALDGTGVATVTLSDLDVGTDSVRAYYYGDQVYAPTSVPATSVTVTAASTTTTVSANPSGPVAYGAPVTLSAVVRNSDSTADPAGTVEFSSGGAALGTATLAGNGDGTSTASYTTTVGQLPLGTDSLDADFVSAIGSGFSPNFLSSSAASGSVPIENAPTVVSVDSDANPAAIGQLVGITATVGATGGSDAMPQGTVTFTEGDTTLGTGTLVAGVATLGTATLGVGDHAIVASYTPTAAFAASSGQFTQTIDTAETTTTITGPATGAYGQSATFDLTVVGAGGGHPDGTVTLTDGTQTLTTIPITAGVGSVTLSAMHAGIRHLVASFDGDGDYLASTGTLDYTVTAAGTTTVLVAPASSAFGDSVTLTATVQNTSATDAPTGQVTFVTPFGELGTVTLTPGTGNTSTAMLTTDALPQSSLYPGGKIPIEANFVPATPGDFSESSDTQQATVLQGTTAVSLAVTQGTVGTALVATATISVTRGHGTPTGTVQFSYTGGPNTVVSVVNGQAVLSGILMPRGQGGITAVYTSGDSNFLTGIPDGSNYSSVSVNIGQAAPAVALTSSASGSLAYGAADTLTASVVGAGAADAPTGIVTFTAVGPQGSTVLGTASLTPTLPLLTTSPRGGTATLIATNIPVGDQLITASYAGDFNYTMAASSSIAQTVVGSSTTTTVTATPLPSVVGRQVTYSAQVVGSGGATPTGTVAFVLDGVSLGSKALANGAASVSTTPRVAGSPRLVATYTPADGNFAGSTGSETHDVVLIPTTIVLSADDNTPGLGQEVNFTVTVTPPAGYTTVTSSVPVGTVTISDAAGNECVTGVHPGGTAPGEVSGSCTIAWTGIGAPEVAAVYTGDSNFAGGTSNPVALFIAKQAPTISFDPSGTRAWVGGETTTLYWTVAGPSADDAPITITLGTDTVCTSTARVGSCDYTFPAGPSGTRSFALHYGGDSNWAAKDVTLARPITACVPFAAPTVTPAGTGTVTTLNTPDCDGGTGFLAGDSVGFSGTANNGYTLNGWFASADKGTTTTVVASYPGVVTTTAYINLNCVVVSLYSVDPGVPTGDLLTSSDPNCGATPREWTRTAAGMSGTFSPGTALTVTARTPVNVGGPPQAFYQWNGLDAGADPLASTTVLNLVPGTDRQVSAVFGVVCYHHISFPTPDGGTAELGAPNCTDPSGPGYASGSTVSVSTHATGTNYFTGWAQLSPVKVTSSDSSGSTGTLKITGDNIALSASYGGCVQFSLVVAANTMGNGLPSGTASVDSAGNCPSKGAGWYSRGSTVTLTAVPSRGGTFGGWSGLPVMGADATFTTALLQLNASGTETATFYDAQHCVPLNLVSKPAGALTLTASFLNGNGTGTCPAGEYDESIGGGSNGSNPVVLTATANVGTPVIGWSGTTNRLVNAYGNMTSLPVAGQQGDSRTLAVYGASTFTAWSCETLDTHLTLISPNGTEHTTTVPENTDFIDVSPTPDCPFGQAYTIGQSVYPLANGPAAGYTFVGWRGAITGDNPFPTTPVKLDGSASSAPLTAVYQVQCHTLTSNFDNVALSPAPNCPDTPASEHKYIGGTAVTLQQTGDGNLVFRNWTGTTDGTVGSYAITQMNADVAIYADYTSKSIGETITSIASVVGDTLANATKKLVGVAATVATGLLMGSNPITAAVGMTVLLGKVVQGIADALGVSSDGLVAFESGISAISSMVTFLTAAASCVTVWSTTSNSPPTTSGASSASSASQGDLGATLLAQQNAATLAAQKDAQKQAILSSSNLVGDAKAVVGRLGTGGAIAAGIYGSFVDSSGGGWGDTASEAWTGGGDVYASCYEAAIPSYFDLPGQ
jgi:hypothetical protein